MALKYSDKLKDPRWQKKRLEIFERDEWACQVCGDSETTLCVHHLRYILGREPWEYDNRLLLTLCEPCHQIEFEFMNQSIDVLIEQIKDRRFLCSDVQQLAEAINGLKMFYPADVMASIINYIFRDEEVMQELCKKYFSHLAIKNAKKEIGNK